MSAKVMGLALEADLPRPEKFILLALADHSKEDGSDVYPSVARIEWKTGYSERQVRSIIDRLESRGILQIVHHGGSGPADVRKYRIILPKIPQLPDFQTWKGAKTAPMVRVQSETEKGAISDRKGCNLEQNKGAKTAPESITRTNTETSLKSPAQKNIQETYLRQSSDIQVEQIAAAHPNNAKPTATERAICDQLIRLTAKGMEPEEATIYLLSQTKKFAQAVADWPIDEVDFVPQAHNWFIQRSYEPQAENTWSKKGKNSNGKSNIQKSIEALGATNSQNGN
jgi:hypothetical protein